MRDSGKRKQAKAIEGELIEYRGSPLRTRLGTIRHIKDEMARVYREARMGLLKTSEATRLVYILGQMATLIRDHEIERRVEQLEKQQDERFKETDHQA
ncbi:hypothetical protein [Nitrosomonas nitrosa]|uniref:hypothetical protein n=1 Tax=Nitrosomonas nitrosa TaxID=52442 RepID=UPI0023F6F0B2|nr:hypothetical protein [Nitrosomonas nitrosa]MCO6433472.1 hypothetical protein [Nitrosomonas nitrosa]